MIDDKIQDYNDGSLNIAIIGMAGRFPGAGNIDKFWERLCNGEDMILTLSTEELKAAGVSEEEMNNPDYVKR